MKVGTIANLSHASTVQSEKLSIFVRSLIPSC